jgi:DNA-binding GntR family transcriptional regulator
LSFHSPPSKIGKVSDLDPKLVQTAVLDPTAAEASLPLGELIRRDLRERIIGGQLKPGERIRQEALAKESGTSRIPVREALRELAAEGLVILEPHVGARVARLDLEELVEIYLLRERLEPMAIALSAPHLSDKQLGALRSYVEQMERFSAPASDHSRRDWLELDKRFHLATFAEDGSPRLNRLIASFWDATQQYRRIYTLLPTRLEITRAEHRLLLEALERRDSADAERLLHTHIRRTRLILTSHPELFDDGHTDMTTPSRPSAIPETKS